MPLRCVFQIAAVAVTLLTSCNTPPKADQTFIVEPSIDANVQNGTAFDHATVDIGSARRIVLPNNTTVRRGGQKGKLVLYMAKTLAFAGHPPVKIGLDNARKYMGCAYAREDDAIVIATFGEWDSVTGGAVLRLIAVVPDGVEVELRKGLWGPYSEALQRNDPHRKPVEVKDWYGPPSPAPGWMPIPSTPDPDHTAKF